MSTNPATHDVILDSSVLINFLAIDRTDLLGRHSRYRFLITAHVRSEITHPVQHARLEAAIEASQLHLLEVGGHDELATFAHLTTTLGAGESAAIAAAAHRSLRVAVEDRAARRAATPLVGHSNILTTTQLMVGMIQAGLLTVQEADAIKLDWATNHRFNLAQFQSFADILPAPP